MVPAAIFELHQLEVHPAKDWVIQTCQNVLALWRHLVIWGLPGRLLFTHEFNLLLFEV
ncbi:hypothetical protein GKIL_3811 [Gloeobacter kilaueensis JS1]|uniref:Uncharacterized protein n=1 Tax=Gloeobacter kilaueensis (strain ATCC BAA-2537 / CCAP 1431/1 / ULC 316 / JS1) TaxID=1183438 RepID=U5QM46_GLOK1|nr:hypothetical protein GKIL_3811 [Gloeobacter kilaueensis JS1]